jgi:hypothetical protein
LSSCVNAGIGFRILQCSQCSFLWLHHSLGSIIAKVRHTEHCGALFACVLALLLQKGVMLLICVHV